MKEENRKATAATGMKGFFMIVFYNPSMKSRFG